MLLRRNFTFFESQLSGGYITHFLAWKFLQDLYAFHAKIKTEKYYIS